MNDRSGHSFSAVLSEHEDLEHLFENHQRALLSKDVGAALATITTFENALKRHISYEDEVLLPLYASKGAEVEGGNLPIFHAEHRKLREMCTTLTQHTNALYVSGDMLGSILKLLDEEALFKGLFKHHSLREENLLFPGLDACTTEAERQKALA
jgi:hemerythrin-like domain-containing protein